MDLFFSSELTFEQFSSSDSKIRMATEYDFYWAPKTEGVDETSDKSNASRTVA